MERLREMISVMEELIFDIEESIDAIARFERQRDPFLLECPLSVRNLGNSPSEFDVDIGNAQPPRRRLTDDASSSCAGVSCRRVIRLSRRCIDKRGRRCEAVAIATFRYLQPGERKERVLTRRLATNANGRNGSVAGARVRR